MKVHLAWMGITPPHYILECFKSVSDIYSHHEINFWTDGSFDVSASGIPESFILRDINDIIPQMERDFPEVMKMLNETPHKFKSPLAVKSDIIRLVIMMNEGGLYLDSDVLCTRSLFEECVDLMVDDIVLFKETNVSICSCTFFAAPGSEKFKKFYEYGQTCLDYKTWGFVGPAVYIAMSHLADKIHNKKVLFELSWRQLDDLYRKNEDVSIELKYPQSCGLHLSNSRIDDVKFDKSITVLTGGQKFVMQSNQQG